MNAKTVLMAAALVALFAAGVNAAKVKNVAVVEAVVDANCGACKSIEKSEVGQITAELRRVAVNNLSSDRYKVMTKETIQAQSEEVLQECASENCIIKLGDKIGAEYIVKSGISKFGKRFILSVEMYETKDGTLVAAIADPIRSESLDDIIDKIPAACAGMYSKFADAENVRAAQQQAAKYQPPAPSVVDASGILTDGRDGKKYKTVVIDGKRWTAENLNRYEPKSGDAWSTCQNNDNSYCDKYGRLYTWSMAKTVCPAGWRLPSRQEWQSLVDYAGGKDKAGKKLKARRGWDGNGNGTNNYGFSALPGSRSSDGSFGGAGAFGYWWTATESNSDSAYYREMVFYSGDADERKYAKSSALSVRCVAD